MFGYPHTSCGCFEAIAFYIPEVDGVGIVDRGFEGTAVNGLAFSTMANQTGGGKQVEGFNGIAIEYMRSPKFLQADGGWSRVVWLPSNVKERVQDAIPPELRDKIATEKDVTNTTELKDFLKEKGHPIVKKWPEEVVEVEAAPEEAAPTEYALPQVTMAAAPGLIPGVGEGFQLVFKNVKIKADKLIIRREEKKGK
jgi:acetyl-CoA decarbonylase/synthase complex subunit beta